MGTGGLETGTPLDFCERLGRDLADEATHDGAVEVLLTIRGLGGDEAESASPDLVFPAEPFAR